MFMILHSLIIVPQVEIRVAKLAVYRAEGSQVVRTSLYGRLEEGHAGPAVPRLT